jgi:hypothetical protein
MYEGNPKYDPFAKEYDELRRAFTTDYYYNGFYMGKFESINNFNAAFAVLIL